MAREDRGSRMREKGERDESTGKRWDRRGRKGRRRQWRQLSKLEVKVRHSFWFHQTSVY